MCCMTYPESFSDRVAAEVRAEMARQKRTARDMAVALEMGARAAERRVNGDIEFGLNELQQVADWLGVDREQLVTGRRAGTAVAS